MSDVKASHIPMAEIQAEYQLWTKTYQNQPIDSVQKGSAYVKRASSLVPILSAFADQPEGQGYDSSLKDAAKAFAQVVKLEEKRPDNDARLTAIFIIETTVMGTLLGIDGLEAHRRNTGYDGPEIEDLLSEILQNIKRDILNCGNRMDAYYTGQSRRIFQTWKAQECKKDMLNRCDQFIDILVNLETILNVPKKTKASALKSKFSDLYKHLFLPRETWEKNTINTTHQLLQKKHLSADNPWPLLDDDAAFKELLKATDDPTLKDALNESGSDRGVKSAELEQVKGELRLSLEDLGRRNEDIFTTKIQLHTKTLEDSIKREAAFVVSSLAGPYERLHHPDLKELWKEMKWIFCIDNDHFTSALLEFYLDRFTSGRSRQPIKDSTQIEADDVEAKSAEISSLSRMGALNDKDVWTLKFINDYRDRISKAIDSDESGFVRISEVNAFTDKMPGQEWSLPQWCAYATIGWLYEARVYRKRIHQLISKMFEMQAKVLPNNRSFMSIYIMTSIVPFAQIMAWEPTSVDVSDIPDELRILVHKKIKNQDAVLRTDLDTLKWTITDEMTLNLLFNDQPLEQYLLRLSVLLLEHTYQVMRVAQKYTLDYKEYDHLQQPFRVLLSVSWDRNVDLKKQYRESKLDPASEIKTDNGGIWYCYDLWDEKPLPFSVQDIYDFKHDEGILKEFSAVLSTTTMPYLKYQTWEDHIKLLHRQNIPRQIPDSWNDEPHGPSTTQGATELVRLKFAEFPLTSDTCDICKKQVKGFVYMCILCEQSNYSICSTCYRKSLSGNIPKPHEATHPVVRLALYTLVEHRRWMSMDALDQIENIRFSFKNRGFGSDTEGTGEASDDEDTSSLDESSDGEVFYSGTIIEDTVPPDSCCVCGTKLDYFHATTYKCFRHCCTNSWVCERCANSEKRVTNPKEGAHQWWHSLIIIRPSLLHDDEIPQYDYTPEDETAASLSAIQDKLDKTSAALEDRMTKLENTVSAMFAELRNFMGTSQHGAVQAPRGNVASQSTPNASAPASRSLGQPATRGPPAVRASIGRPPIVQAEEHDVAHAANANDDDDNDDVNMHNATGAYHGADDDDDANDHERDNEEHERSFAHPTSMNYNEDEAEHYGATGVQDEDHDERNDSDREGGEGGEYGDNEERDRDEGDNEGDNEGGGDNESGGEGGGRGEDEDEGDRWGGGGNERGDDDDDY